jgi:hypothetical protein
MTARKKKIFGKTWGITGQNIELFSSAYRIAWKQISPVHKREQPDISLRFHASIRRQPKEGATDPLLSPARRLRPSVRVSRERRSPKRVNRCCRQHLPFTP